MEPQGDYNLSIKWWIDGEIQTTQTISMAGTGGVLNSFILGEDASESLLGGDNVLDVEFILGANGKRLQLEIYNSGASQEFFISHILIDYKPLGNEPAE